MNSGYRMELRDIEYFAVVAMHAHLGRAAAALGLSQPALSKSLRRLESALQTKLVKRTPKGVELTLEGSTLLARVSELRLSLKNVAREIAEVGKGRVGRLRIGVGPAISERFLSAAFAAILESVPRSSLQVILSDNDLMIPALSNGELDLIINYHPPQLPDGLVFEHLFSDRYVVSAAASHPLAKKRRVPLADLAHERWALSEPALLPQQIVNEAFRDRRLPPPQIAFESRSAALRLRTVASTRLIDFTSEAVIRQVGRDSAVKTLHVPELSMLRPVGVIHRTQTYRPPIMQRMLDALKTIAKGHSDDLRP
ncbi:MAG: LysR family transcriptional regulator [Xanthobacteraceae bacterium]|nr:LysR family transcriptional regulator [Xanthobacteraceae bacterium]